MAAITIGAKRLGILANAFRVKGPTYRYNLIRRPLLTQRDVSNLIST